MLSLRIAELLVCNLLCVQLTALEYVSIADGGDTSDSDSSSEQSDNDGCQYELIGVTVHTGTADGGHYYSFIRDRLNKNELGQDRWYVVVILSCHYSALIQLTPSVQR